MRKYAGEQELIWGDNHCEHEWATETIKHDALRHRPGEHCIVGSEKNPAIRQGNQIAAGFCSLCGAWKGAFGLEPTPEMYVQHTIEILREIRRVLRKDGVCFYNIGDSYNGSGGAGGDYNKGGLKEGQPKYPGRKVNTLKPKDLCLIPFRVAIACQTDGWWVRSVIIWSKQNPMPESVKDRPTESHEYILMMTKNSRYYWDQDAVREPVQQCSIERLERAVSNKHKYIDGAPGQTNQLLFRPRPNKKYLASKAPHEFEGSDAMVSPFDPEKGRNIRSVWEFPTKPYPGAHFAVFPDKLPELCIKAATPEEGCCSKCGAPCERIVEKGFTSHDGESKTAYTDELGHNASQLAKLRQADRAKGGEYVNTSKTTGWQPTCKCDAPRVPSLVLDPFMGAGTTLVVAKKLNRYGVGYELSEEYCRLAVGRMKQQVLL